jgi:hypothetical protein
MSSLVVNHLAAAALCLFALGAIASAQPAGDGAALGECARISEDAQRLACYDRVVRGGSEPAGAPETSLGRWQAVAGSAGAVVFRQEPLHPSAETDLVVELSCRNDRAAVSVQRNGALAISATVTATVRANDRLVSSDLWNVSRDTRAATFSGDVRALLELLPGQGSLEIRLEGSSRWRFEGAYQLDGIVKVRERLLASCRR